MESSEGQKVNPNLIKQWVATESVYYTLELTKLQEIINLSKEVSNDMELGKIIRKLVSEFK